MRETSHKEKYIMNEDANRFQELKVFLSTKLAREVAVRAGRLAVDRAAVRDGIDHFAPHEGQKDVLCSVGSIPHQGIVNHNFKKEYMYIHL